MRNSISRKLCFCALAITLAASAQSVQVYSQFARFDPFGNIIPADKGEQPPREILSPALPRNSVTGFHLIVEAPTGTAFNLYIGLNPDNAVEMTLYRERYKRSSGVWIPDELEPVPLPYRGRMETEGIPGQTAQAFWIDFRVERGAAVQRIKIEPQVSLDNRWVRYPMEARIVEAVSPAARSIPVVLPPYTAPSDFTARKIFRARLCGISEKVPSESALSIRSMIARDAARDVAMAASLPTGFLWEAVNADDPTAWCKSDLLYKRGPEWYLRLRDRIINAFQ